MLAFRVSTDMHFALPMCSAVTVDGMGWLRSVGSLKSYVSFAKEPYKRDDILQKRPMILRSLLIVATSYVFTMYDYAYVCVCTVVCVYLYFISRGYMCMIVYNMYSYVCTVACMCIHVHVYM